MRYFLLIMLLCFSAQAAAEDYYYLLGSGPYSNVHFKTADDACQAEYNYDISVYVPAHSKQFTMSPYRPPTVFIDMPPKYLNLICQQSYTDTSGDKPVLLWITNTISRQGDNCKPGETYNSISGYCEAPNEEQSRKGQGDPGHSVLAGIVCRGDPINVGNGNVFEEEVDYADADGELVFSRVYNSLSGFWIDNYHLQVGNDSKSLLVNLPDAREVLFLQKADVATPEAGERGAMVKINGQWTYTAPTNDQFTYNASGQLVQWRKPNGLTQTISSVSAADRTQTKTITDSQGHRLQTTSDVYGAVIKLVAGDLTINYNFDASHRLMGLTRTMKGKTSTRSYLYEDAAHPRLLTGIIDERGSRSASWSYDSQGRAIANQQADGANKVTLTYGTDGSTTVTNALGQSTTYRYAIVQGVKRVTAIEGEPVLGCPASNSRYTYTTDGLMATKTDARGYITAYTYDAQGRQIKQVEAQGTADERTTTTTWDGTGFRPATVTTADRVTTYTYDAQGRTLSTTVHSLKD